MSFEPASAKLTIASTDGGPQVSAQYNPKEVQIDKSIPWSKVNQANQSNDQGIHLEFTGAEGRSMSVELLFDGYETGGGAVLSSIQSLETLASVIDPSSTDENRRRPHLCVVTWGAGGMPSFRCVIESLSTKYTMFSSEGAVLRATCTVKLKEADVVSMKSGGAA
jgi:phage protein U